MIIVKNAAQLEKMRRAGAVVYEVLMAVKQAVKPGISTLELDEIAYDLIRAKGASPSFLGYRGYPATLNTSVDDEVVHGIPSKNVVLREGSIVGIDCGAIVEGMHADSALTVPVGEVSGEAARLIEQTELAFWKGAFMAREGRRVSDIGAAVQRHALSCGYDVVRALCGHGVGERLHEDPEVHNYGPPGKGEKLFAGMTLAIEPMVAAGKYPVTIDADGWTVRTKDGSLCSHYEHTVAVRAEGPPEILTLPQGAPKGIWESLQC